MLSHLSWSPLVFKTICLERSVIRNGGQTRTLLGEFDQTVSFESRNAPSMLEDYCAQPKH